MINGLQGIPGSGKSYEAVVYHVLPALQAGRKVITNLPLHIDQFAAIDSAFPGLLEVRVKPEPIRGVWDASAIQADGSGEAFQLFPDGHTEPAKYPVRVDAQTSMKLVEPPVFGHVWDFYSTWRHPESGIGPLFIVDECHIPLHRTKTPEALIQWFKLHRHYNVDVLLMTQNFRHINQDIADLFAMLVKCRKADILGDANSYVRKVHAGYRGEVISNETRKYKPQYFGLYRSHTQGRSVAESAATDVAPFLVKWKRFARVFYLFAAALFVYAFFIYDDKPAPAKAARPSGESLVLTGPVLSDEEAARRFSPPGRVPQLSQASPATSEASAPPSIPDPFDGKKIHLTGWMLMGGKTVYTFAVSMAGQRIFDLRLADLIKSGYTFEPLGECSGVLTFDGKARPVTCDAPALATGSRSMPIVISETTGASSQPL